MFLADVHKLLEPLARHPQNLLMQGFEATPLYSMFYPQNPEF